MKRLLSTASIALIKYLLSDTRISDKVFDNTEDKTKFKSITICENGTIVLGKTSCVWWNRLLACQNKIPFNDFALKVWDALVNLSTGVNGAALEKGLSTEIAKLSQREGDYDTLVKRLVDCYEHVCNNKGDSSPAGDSVKSEPKIVGVNRKQVPESIVINVNGMERKVIPFKDSAGDKFVDIEYGVTGVRINLLKRNIHTNPEGFSNTLSLIFVLHLLQQLKYMYKVIMLSILTIYHKRFIINYSTKGRRRT